MTTAEPLTQTSKTVPVQDMQFFSLGQPTDTSRPLAVVLGLGNVVAAFCIAGSSGSTSIPDGGRIRAWTSSSSTQ
jgi:hypothetical protein